ncbi:MAG TPA: DUF6790 family protein [Methanoregulaceae archaeon]|nr:DUF6790 family protein [Methanoregulaceae archaeon]
MEFSIAYLYSGLILIGVVINLAAWRHGLSGRKAMETVLFWCLLAGVGFTGISVFICQLLFPGTSLDPSGWPFGGPFHWGSGAVWLAIGLAGIACAKWRNGFWGATILISSVVLLGNAADQIDKVFPGNNAGNVIPGPVFWFELALPIVMVLLWLGIRAGRRNRDVWLTPVERRPS